MRPGSPGSLGSPGYLDLNVTTGAAVSGPDTTPSPQDFLASILEDEQLHTLLNLYDQISTNSYRPFRWRERRSFHIFDLKRN